MELFGASHLAAIGAIACAAALLAFLVRRRPGWGRPVRIGLAAVLLAQTAAFILVETLRGELSPWDFVPLHLCDFAVFVGAYALVSRRPLASEVLYFWALAGTTLAIVTPDPARDFPHSRYWFYFGLHGGVVTASAVLTFGAGLRPRPGAPLRVFLWTNAYAAVVGLVDLVTGANFLYLRQKPAASTLLDYMGPWPVYILVVELVALALFWALFLPFRLRGRGREGPGRESSGRRRRADRPRA